MIVQRYIEDGVRRLLPQGETLDIVSVEALKAAAQGCFEAGEHLVVDLSWIKLIDSAGLGALVGFHRAACAAGKRAVFACATPGVLPVIRMIHLDRILEWAADVPDALARLREERVAVEGPGAR